MSWDNELKEYNWLKVAASPYRIWLAANRQTISQLGMGNYNYHATIQSWVLQHLHVIAAAAAARSYSGLVSIR